jgi:ATPase subunit of ABC transporter with duplicated ATPase domains
VCTFLHAYPNQIVLIVQNLSYRHPNKDLLFERIDLSIAQEEKSALVGNNGIGKSTLLRLIARELSPASGEIRTGARPYYVPQHYGQFDHLTVAEALRISDKLSALREILSGDVSDANLELLGDDWTVEERVSDALRTWGLAHISLDQPLRELSGGQKTKLFLAGIQLPHPELILLDEPTNHLDTTGREQLYDFIRTSSHAMLIISHDRTLLNELDTIFELSSRGIARYGGNYDLYATQKQIERDALQHDVQSKEKDLRKAKEIERESMERKQRQDARGKKKLVKAGTPQIMIGMKQRSAQNSAAKLQGVHSEKIGSLARELHNLRSELPELDKMKFNFDDAALHKGKLLFEAQAVNFGYADQRLWQVPLDIRIVSGERVVLRGANGSGKSTLIRLLLGELEPSDGTLRRAEMRSVYIDQDYSVLDDALTVYEQAQAFNVTNLPEHEVKIRLARYLYFGDDWEKPTLSLSGGQKMRLILCCITIMDSAPDVILLDEPTNNLDIQNVEILTNAIKHYRGTLIVVSHDRVFVDEIGVDRLIDLAVNP